MEVQDKRCKLFIYSPTLNLYLEIHQDGQGRNASATNIILAIYAIQDTALGAKKLIELLTCLDIPAPIKSFMQTPLCKTSRKMAERNKLDMNDKIQQEAHGPHRSPEEQ